MRKWFVFAMVSFCVCMAGCEKEQDNNINSDNNYSDVSMITSEGNTVAAEDMNVKEELDENLSVQAEVHMPEKELSMYSSELKQFDYDKVATIFWPEAGEDEVTTDEFGSKYYGEESFGGEKGSLIYRKNDDADYMDTLCSYAKEKNLIPEKDLAFATREEIKREAEELISKFEIGCELDEPYIASLNGEDLDKIQEEIGKDENYENLFRAKGMENSQFDSDTEIYYLEYSFVVDDIHVFGYEDPTVQYSGDNPLLAQNMRATVMLSESGIERFSLEGVLDVLDKKTEKAEIIGYEGIKKALEKRFGDVILTESYKVTNIWMEYFPLIRKESFDQVDVVPVWCCDFEINGETTNYTLRFHAVTGEEIS